MDNLDRAKGVGDAVFDGGRVKIEKQPTKIVVSLWLDSYDNIFSDFDPRPYSHRALSDDFISEAKKVTYEVKPGSLDLTLLIPSGMRDLDHEKYIRMRLHSHFRKHAVLMEKEMRKLLFNGIAFTILGFVMMFVAASVLLVDGSSIWVNLLRTVLEPGGWFLSWYGLDQIFYTSRQNVKELDFNKKMSRAEIEFDSYKA